MSAEAWDGRAEVALGVFIRRLLADDPPPPGSRLAADLRLWAEQLQSDGQARLAAAGGRRLVAAAGGGEP